MLSCFDKKTEVEIFGIPENVPRLLKNAFHISDERQLGLESLDFCKRPTG